MRPVPVTPRPQTAAAIRASVSGMPPSRWPVPDTPAWFRPAAALEQQVRSLADAYPALVRLEDVGDSTETQLGTARRDLLALRVGAGAGTGKPKLLVLAGVHGREAANPQLVLDAVTGLVRGYGSDPDATRLLDTRELVVVPLVNPDGRAAVERGLATRDPAYAWQRKNRSEPGGVDLNRNFDFQWGAAGKGLRDPASVHYAGPRPASEAEVQAMQALIARERPNLMLDVHSSGEVVLFPWGHTRQPAPDHADLQAVARLLAGAAGYRFEPSNAFHEDSGTSKDWAYGRLGIPAFTIETGKLYIPLDADYPQMAREVDAVLRTALDIADAPYARARAGVRDAETGAGLAAAAWRISTIPLMDDGLPADMPGAPT